MLIAVLILGSSGCALTEKKLTSSGAALEPRMAWNGAHFGIVYYYRPAPGAPLRIDALKVDSKGLIAATKQGLASVSGVYSPFWLSDLVWNDSAQQFAFAYSEGKVIRFVRLDANLTQIGTPLAIKWNLLPHEHPYLEDLSLVWNGTDKQYCLAFVTKHYTTNPEIHDNLYVSQISSGGDFVGSNSRRAVVKGNCHRTSVAYNKQTGKYAVAYFRDKLPKLGVFDVAGGWATEFPVTSSTFVTWKEAIRLLCDENSGDFYLAEISYAGELDWHVMGKNGPASGKSFNEGQGFDRLFSLAKLLPGLASHAVVAASQHQQIRYWLITGQGPATPGSALAPTSGSFSSSPSLAVADAAPYLAWIQDDLLYFGRIEVKP